MNNSIIHRENYRILATIDMRPYSDEHFEVGFERFDSSTFSRLFSSVKKIVHRMQEYDALVFTSSTTLTLISILLIRLMRPSKRIYMFDIILKFPKNKRERVIAFLKSIMLRAVSGYLMIHKDWSGYKKYYGLNLSKCRYIPFKANNYSSYEKFDPQNRGYVLCCGASQRDIDTLIKAAKMVDIPVTILLPDSLAQTHNTKLTLKKFPPNVTLIREYLDKEQWYTIMAECFIVVVPIVPDSLQPAGISVYLEAMLFRKPVVITRGSSTEGILEHEKHALIVPHEDPHALATSLQRLKLDTKLYSSLAFNGFEYAKSLKGHDRLMRDLLHVVACWH